MNIRLIIVLLATTFSVLAQADETDVREVKDLGRLFMSPGERAELDRLRKIPTAPVASNTTSARITEAQPDPGENASGYIIRAEGEAYLWVDGDFKKVRHDATNKELADQRISITRHGQAPLPDVQTPSTLERGDEESR